MDRITTAMLGAGAALLLFRIEPASLVSTIALGAAFFGAYRATGNKLVLGSIALTALARAAFAAAAFFHEDFPVADSLFRGAGSSAFALSLIVTVVAAHARVGRALVGLAAVSGVLALLARVVATLGDLVRPDGAFAGSALRLAEWIAEGQGTVATLLAAAVLAVLATGPTVTAPSRSPAPFVLGAVGCALLAASLVAVGAHALPGRSAFAPLAWCVTMAIGWLLVAVGMAGLARSGVKAAWGGLALAALEIVVCTPTVVLGARAMDDALGVALLPVFLGLLGLVVALLAPQDLALREVRALAAALVLAGVLGSCAATALFAASVDAIGVRVGDPFWPLESARLVAAHGLALAAAVLALLATPPLREPA